MDSSVEPIDGDKSGHLGNCSVQRSVKRVLVIGAGPSGVAAAIKLDAEQAFSQITVYEQRSDVGGIWNADALSPRHDAQHFPSPIYADMESNIASVMMQYDNRPYPPDSHFLHPSTKQTLAYLRAYADRVRRFIKFRRQVIQVSQSAQEQWHIRVLDLVSGQCTEEVYDAVIVANGKYTKEWLPSIPGYDAWREAHPSTIMHSKAFRGPETFAAKKVLLIGYSYSGIDIAKQIKHTCRHPLIVSKRTMTALSGDMTEPISFRPLIVRLDHRERAAYFEDGTVEADIDCVVFCTGYTPHYPFLDRIPGFQGGDGQGSTQLYRHMFFPPAPTLAIILLPRNVIAFPFAEAQASVISGYLSGRLSLPSCDQMEADVQKTRLEKGAHWSSFHDMSSSRDLDYMDLLYRMSVQGQEEIRPDLLPPRWGAKERWLRAQLKGIRLAYERKGKERFKVRTIEELGFHYDE